MEYIIAAIFGILVAFVFLWVILRKHRLFEDRLRRTERRINILRQKIESSVDEGTNTSDRTPDVESKFNELRREYLDDQTSSTNLWIGIFGVVLAVFTVAIPIAGAIFIYFNNNEFQDIKSNTQKYRDEAERYAGEAKEYFEKIEERSQQYPNFSSLDRAMDEAERLKKVGRIAEAIEKLQSIAKVAEGSDDKLAARAWFFIGHIHQEASKFEEALSAYTKTIGLNPQYFAAYNNRGIVKAKLGQYDSADEDFELAIYLNSNYAQAHHNRAFMMAELGKYKVALTGYGIAIGLDSDYAEAYMNRGIVKVKLGDIQGAEGDFQIGLKLAKQQNQEDLEVKIEQQIQKLKSIE